MRHGEQTGHTVLASLAAMGGALAASACCLPLMPFLLAAGLAGSAGFLIRARPYLIAASVLLLVYGCFGLVRFRRMQGKLPVLRAALLLLSVSLVGVAVVSPQLFERVITKMFPR